jgi:mRNA interferase MazF
VVRTGFPRASWEGLSEVLDVAEIRAKAPGNLLLRKGEANLPRPSVVNVSQVITVDKSVLREKIGTLSRQRVREIVAGLGLILEPREL